MSTTSEFNPAIFPVPLYPVADQVNRDPQYPEGNLSLFQVKWPKLLELIPFPAA